MRPCPAASIESPTCPPRLLYLIAFAIRLITTCFRRWLSAKTYPFPPGHRRRVNRDVHRGGERPHQLDRIVYQRLDRNGLRRDVSCPSSTREMSRTSLTIPRRC